MKKIFILIISFVISFSLINEANAIWNPFKLLKISSSSDNEYLINREKVQKSLDELVNAYESRNLSAFMRQVSDNYTYDKSILEDKIRKDFFNYSYINIRYVINNLISDSQDKISVSINFVRTMENRRTSEIVSDKGITELIFRNEDGILKLYDQRKPYLFSNN
ncbi:MAG: hypothetical protein ACD_20C00350G0029 [uncultured bacterium]|nr:MAG: hypothetical protein ACD_20C00350G0029 [uncultured bacterium]HBH18481.1 hypothetical protein [Cyanobacteria bacterium UBA9579]